MLRRLPLLLALSLAGCGSETIVRPPAPGFQPGTSDRIEVTVLDEVTRAPLALASVELTAIDGAVLGSGTTDGEERMAIAATGELAAVRIEAPGHVPERWVGPLGRSLVVPVALDVAPSLVEVTLTDGDADWVVVATSPARALRATPLTPATVASCAPAASGCTAQVMATPDATLFAFRTDAGTPPSALRVLGALAGPHEVATAIELDVERVPVSVPDPLASTEVVGVPGFAFGGRVAVFDWPLADGTLPVPDTMGGMGSAWGIFSIAPSAGQQSMLVQRGVEEGFASWDGWLEAPGYGGAGAVTRPSGADLLAASWLDGSGRVLLHELSFGGAFSPPAGAVSGRLRAIDTSLDAATFDLDASERAVVRLADLEIAAP